MFLVICYAVHEKKLAGVYQFHSQDEAFACMEMDVKNTYDEEIANSGNSMDDIDFDIDETKGIVTDHAADCCWTWEVVEIKEKEKNLCII